MTTLYSRRLQLRPAVLADVDALHAMNDDGAVASRDRLARFVEQSLRTFEAHGFGLWVLSRPGSDGLLGWCGLRAGDDPTMPELLYGIAPAERRRGLATEAARVVLEWAWSRPEIRGVWAATPPANQGSIRVLEHLGMRARGREPLEGAEHLLYSLARDPVQALRGGRGQQLHPTVTALAQTLRLNTELLLNCLSDLSDEDARRQPAGTGNTIAFLTAHLVDSRHFIAASLGAPAPNPLARYLEGSRSQDEVAELPDLRHLRAAWERISAHLAVLIERLDTPALHRRSGALPGSDGTLLGNLAFLVQHDCYHLGQIGLLRRQLGYPAMSYHVPEREPGRAGA